ncbi:MAG: hypothetical protein JKY15_03620 [Deltaproteobacteria bacterium]|nr:hypothetical protein [Deltaproteobacteria bacterium]
MKGVGKTTFSSQMGIESFEVEILGKMDNYLGKGQDLIVVRAIGEPFLKSNIPAGMSGSPIYIDGKLLGALSYSFGTFTIDAIGGVTPIVTMQKGSNIERKTLGQFGEMKPISVPLVAVGLSSQVAEHFKSELLERGFAEPILGAGGLGESSRRSELIRPGDPFSAILIRGDMSLSALGTVTHVEGNQFWGLGHGFLQNGQSELPVAGAEIVTTVWGKGVPYKMGQPTNIIGVLKTDRYSGVSAQLGKKPRFMPLEVKVGDKTWNYEVARTVRDTPFLASIALSNSLILSDIRELGGTYRIEVSAQTNRKETVKYKRTVTAPGLPLEARVIASFLEPIMMFQEQAFKNIEFTRVVVDVRHQPEVRAVQLVGMSIPKDPKPGKGFEILVYGQPWRKGLKKYRLRLPRFVPRYLKEYELVGLDRAQSLALEREAGFWAEQPNYQSFMQKVRSMPSDTQVCFYAKLKNPVRNLMGYNLTELPISLKESLINVSSDSGLLFNSQIFRLGCAEMGAVVTGKVSKRYGKKKQSGAGKA